MWLILRGFASAPNIEHSNNKIDIVNIHSGQVKFTLERSSIKASEMKQHLMSMMSKRKERLQDGVQSSELHFLPFEVDVLFAQDFYIMFDDCFLLMTNVDMKCDILPPLYADMAPVLA